MSPWLILLASVPLICGCGTAPLKIDARAAAPPAAQSSDRFIVAGIDNDSTAFLGRAASTPHGYDAIAPYGPTAHARQVLRDIEREYGLREVNAWPIEPLHMHCAVLEVPAGTDPVKLLVTLSHDPRLKLAQPLHNFSTSSENYNDPYVSLQRGFDQMDVADAHPWSRGEGVRVAIIDTGADTEHPDLRGTIVSAANFVDADERQFRADRHGTEVAGVIAAVANNREGIVGIAPAAHLMIYKACWQTRVDADPATCNSFTLARALTAAFDARAQVVNLSIAGPADPLLDSLIGEGLRRGIVFVGAAPDAAAQGGSLMQQAGVIVIASSEAGTRDDRVMSAPGREILTLTPGGHYDFASGVSMATAQVSGVIALMLSKDRALLPAEAYQLLRKTSVHTDGATDGGGRIDACAAVIAIVGRGACRSTPIALVKQTPN
jgi:subtilisin family serine protease